MPSWHRAPPRSQTAHARAGDESIQLPEEALLRMAHMLGDKQVQKAGGLTVEALLLHLDVLVARGEAAAAAALLAGPAAFAVQMPHELLRLQVRAAHACERDAKGVCAAMQSCKCFW